MSVKIREIYPGKWYLRITYRNIRKTKAVGSKKAAVELARKLTTALDLYGLDALKILEEDHESEIRRTEAPAVPTVDEYQAQWLAELAQTDLKRSTKISYNFQLRKHVVPAFGNDRLDQLDYLRLKAWVIEKARTYSKDSVRLMVGALRTMLEEAVHEGIIPVNPVTRLGKFYRSAKRIKEKIDPFTMEELHLIEAKVPREVSRALRPDPLPRAHGHADRGGLRPSVARHGFQPGTGARQEEHPAAPARGDPEDRRVGAEGGPEPRARRRAETDPGGQEETGPRRRQAVRHGAVGVPERRGDADLLHELPAAGLVQGPGRGEGPAANPA